MSWCDGYVKKYGKNLTFEEMFRIQKNIAEHDEKVAKGLRK